MRNCRYARILMQLEALIGKERNPGDRGIRRFQPFPGLDIGAKRRRREAK